MDKMDVVLVVLNKKFSENMTDTLNPDNMDFRATIKGQILDDTLKNLNLDNVNLLAIITDSDEEKFFQIGNKEIPLKTFINVKGLMKEHKAFFFLISGCENNTADLSKIKKFLTATGSPDGNIVNFEISTQLSKTWLANLRHIEEHGADFFATGNEYTRNGLNLNFIPRVSSDNLGGVILADEYQDLRQSYLTAKYVFEHVKPGTIKFVLIGLSPDSFHYDNSKDFANCAKNFQYLLAFNPEEGNRHDILLKNLISDEIKNDFLSTTSAQADLNFDAVKETIDKKLLAKGIIDWEDDSHSLTIVSQAEKDAQLLKDYIKLCLEAGKKYSVNGKISWKDDKKSSGNATVEKNIKILKDYIKLCLKNGAKPVGVIFPFSEAARKTYNQELLTFFRDTIHKLEENHDFMCVD